MPNADPLSLFQIINSATNDGSHICYKENWIKTDVQLTDILWCSLDSV